MTEQDYLDYIENLERWIAAQDGGQEFLESTDGFLVETATRVRDAVAKSLKIDKDYVDFDECFAAVIHTNSEEEAQERAELWVAHEYGL